MPSDLEVVEANEAEGDDRPAVPRGRILVFSLLAMVFVVLAVLASFQGTRPEYQSWIDHLPGVAYYRIDQPHLKGALYEIPETFASVHNDLCHQLNFSTTGGTMFHSRSFFMGLGRAHFGRIPDTLSGTNQFTLFGSVDGSESAIALVSGTPKRRPAHLLILEHRAEPKHAYHTFPLTVGNEHIYPMAGPAFGTGGYLYGATVRTGEPFTNVVSYYTTTFSPVALGTSKAAAFRIPPADASKTNVFTMFLQSSRGPKLIHVTEEAGEAHLCILNFR